MTPEERKILEEADDQAFQSSQQLADAQISSGIRPPPEITETETTLEPQTFGFEFGEQPQATALPGGGGVPPPSGGTGACCAIDGSCTIETSADCTAMGGTYQGDDTVCSPNPCCPSCVGGFSSGTLLVGATYKITTYESGDDFTNVGAVSNVTGEVFVATGTTPANWSNGSDLIINIVYVTLSGVSLCACTDLGTGASYTMIDGHFPGGTDTGINSEWQAENSALHHWLGGGSNFIPEDPYCYPLEFGTNTTCSGDPDGVNVDPCIINVTCSTPGTWTVTIEHSGWGFFFTGTGCGSADDPILNSFTFCDGPTQVGFDGQAVISFVP